MSRHSGLNSATFITKNNCRPLSLRYLPDSADPLVQVQWIALCLHQTSSNKLGDCRAGLSCLHALRGLYRLRTRHPGTSESTGELENRTDTRRPPWTYAQCNSLSRRLRPEPPVGTCSLGYLQLFLQIDCPFRTWA